MKTCDEPECNSVVFAEKKCKFHWLVFFGKPIKRTPIKKRPYQIPRFSKRRAVQNKQYISRLKERDNDGQVHICFFCDNPIKGRISHHHSEGRIEDDLLNDELTVDAHFTCHDRFHHVSVQILAKETWWPGFLIRLKEKSEVGFRKVTDKFNK